LDSAQKKTNRDNETNLLDVISKGIDEVSKNWDNARNLGLSATLKSELAKENAPDQLYRELSPVKETIDHVTIHDPNMGAAVMSGILGHQIGTAPGQGGFTPEQIEASKLAGDIYDKTGSVSKAAIGAVFGEKAAMEYEPPAPKATSLEQATRAALADLGLQDVPDSYVNPAMRVVQEKYGHLIGNEPTSKLNFDDAAKLMAGVVKAEVERVRPGVTPGTRVSVRKAPIEEKFDQLYRTSKVKSYVSEALTKAPVASAPVASAPVVAPAPKITPKPVVKKTVAPITTLNLLTGQRTFAENSRDRGDSDDAPADGY